jgi:membrane protein required for colicin V production
MIIDWIYLALLAFFLFRGYRKGLVIALFSLIAIVVGIAGAVKLSKPMGELLVSRSAVAGHWAPIITYVLVFCLIAWLIRLVGRFLEQSLKLVALGWVNRICGALLFGLLFSFVSSGFLWILNRMQFIEPETIAQSRIFPLLEPLAPKVYALIGELVPWVKDAFAALSRFFDQINQKLPGHVDTP